MGGCTATNTSAAAHPLVVGAGAIEVLLEVVGAGAPELLLKDLVVLLLHTPRPPVRPHPLHHFLDAPRTRYLHHVLSSARRPRAAHEL